MKELKELQSKLGNNDLDKLLELERVVDNEDVKATNRLSILKFIVAKNASNPNLTKDVLSIVDDVYMNTLFRYGGLSELNDYVDLMNVELNNDLITTKEYDIKIVSYLEKCAGKDKELLIKVCNDYLTMVTSSECKDRLLNIINCK